MSWERKALESIISMLIDEDKKHDEVFNKLYELGVTIDIDGEAYSVLLKALEGWEAMSDNLEYATTSTEDKEMFIERALEQLETNYSSN